MTIFERQILGAPSWRLQQRIDAITKELEALEAQLRNRVGL
jgi:hypothetical protein